MTAYAMLNHESLDGGDPIEDAVLLLVLGETFRALRLAVAANDEMRVIASVPSTIDQLQLPSRTRLKSALAALQRTRDHHDMVRQWWGLLSSAHFFDEDGAVQPSAAEQPAEVVYRNNPAPALRAAWLLE